MSILAPIHKDKRVLVLVLALVLALASFLLFRRSETTSEWKNHTYLILNVSEKFLSGVKDAETGQRGYLITGDDNYLGPFQKAQRDILGLVAQLRSLTSDNPTQQHHIDVLTSMVAKKFSELSQTIELKRNHHDADVVKIVRSNLGKGTMDSIREQIQDFNVTEQNLLVLREAEFTRALYEILVFIIILSSLLVIMFLASIRNQKRLRINELFLMQFAQIIGSSDDAIIGESMEAIITSWNNGAERMFGYSHEEAHGQHISFLTPQQHQHEQIMILDQIRSGTLVKHYDTVRRCKNGKLLDVSVSLSPICDPGGNIVGTSKIARNITERKRAELKLRKSEESLKIAQSMAHFGHWELDIKSGRFVCSDEMYRILGLALQGSLENYDAFLQTVHPNDRALVVNHLRLVQAGNSFDIEFRIILQSGKVRVVHGKGEVFHLGDSSQTRVSGIIRDIHEHDLTKMLGVVQDITERKEFQNKLEEQVNTDVLTGCNSRRHFLERGGEEMLRIRRYGGEISILMLDLDHFKNINDKYGHQVGDITLKKFVHVCQELLREVDVIGRIGGEEFAILLPETGSELALKIAERLCQAVAAAEILLEDASSLHFTTSIGVSSVVESDSRIDEILSRADSALYKAKHAGRNRASA